MFSQVHHCQAARSGSALCAAVSRPPAGGGDHSSGRARQRPLAPRWHARSAGGAHSDVGPQCVLLATESVLALPPSLPTPGGGDAVILATRSAAHRFSTLASSLESTRLSFLAFQGPTAPGVPKPDTTAATFHWRRHEEALGLPCKTHPRSLPAPHQVVHK